MFQSILQDLLARLDLTVAGEDKAYGEIQDSPVTMTILGVEPLALLLGFKITSPHPAQIDLPEDVKSLVSEKKAEVSLENGIAWLSLDDLSDQRADAIANLITSFASAMATANVRLPAGCAQCRSADDVTLVYSDGRCSRLCGNCRVRIVDEVIREEGKLNRPSVLFAMVLPLMFLYVSGAWMLLWWLVDLFLIWANTDKIVLRYWDLLLLSVVLAVIGAVVGYPIGVFLRRSGIPGRTHWVTSAATVLVACAAGECLYLAILLYREFGVFDLGLAARLVVPIFTTHHPAWIAGKVIVGGAIGVGCYGGAKWRKAAVNL